MTHRNASIFARPELAALARDELALLPAYARRQPSCRALIVYPHVSARALPLDLPAWQVTRLHVEDGRLQGDSSCEPDHLPWPEDSFDLVQVQHAADVLEPIEAFVDEIGRVLRPGGVVLWSGLNALGSWRSWCRLRSGASLPLLPAGALRRLLDRSGLAIEDSYHVGRFWPRSAAAGDRAASAVDVFRAAWVLAARKRRANLTLLARRNARPAVPARLAAVPSRRACA